jgi:hypothetical protein
MCYGVYAVYFPGNYINGVIGRIHALLLSGAQDKQGCILWYRSAFRALQYLLQGTGFRHVHYYCLDQLDIRIQAADGKKPVLSYCTSGERSIICCFVLPVIILEG